MLHVLMFFSAYPCFFFVLVYTDKPEHGGFIVDVSDIKQNIAKRPKCGQPDNTVSIFGSPTECVMKNYIHKITDRRLQWYVISVKSSACSLSRGRVVTKVANFATSHKFLGKFVRSFGFRFKAKVGIQGR